MPRNLETLEQKPEPLILATDPEEVMWNAILFGTGLMALLFIAIHGI